MFLHVIVIIEGKLVLKTREMSIAESNRRSLLDLSRGFLVFNARHRKHLNPIFLIQLTQ